MTSLPFTILDCAQILIAQQKLLATSLTSLSHWCTCSITTVYYRNGKIACSVSSLDSFMVSRDIMDFMFQISDFKAKVAYDCK